MPVKFKNDTIIIASNLTASRLKGIRRLVNRGSENAAVGLYLPVCS